jgi:hypothetical protein
MGYKYTMRSVVISPIILYLHIQSPRQFPNQGETVKETKIDDWHGLMYVAHKTAPSGDPRGAEVFQFSVDVLTRWNNGVRYILIIYFV